MLGDSILYLCLCLSILSEHKHILFREGILRLIEAKRNAESHAVLTTLRPGICLVLEKDCCFKIFNSWLRSNLPTAKGPVFLYSDRNQTIRVKGEYADPGIPYFILSPYIEADEQHDCYYYTYSLAQYMDYGLASIYYTILNTIDKSGCSSFDLDEVHYSKARLGSLELCTFSIQELGHVCFTRYFEDGPMMQHVSGITAELVRMAKHRITKTAWSTRAVELLMAMLLERGILKGEVDLEEYPEIVPLLFPFKFIDTESGNWAHIDFVSIGVDLRHAERSSLAHLFNIEKVRRLSAEGGVYIASRRF